MMGPHTRLPEDLDMLNASFCRPDLDSFCRLDRLGLSVTGQQVDEDHSVLRCRVLEPDDWCHDCGTQGVPRDTVVRELADVPLGWRLTILHVRVRRYRCTGCGQIWRQNTTTAAAARTKLSRHAVLWALKSVVIDRLSIARVAGGLGVTWHTVNDAVLAAGRELLINNRGRLDGVRVIGVDEHAWRHTRRGDKFVTSSSTSRRSAIAPTQCGYWTWSKAAPRRCSRPCSKPSRPRSAPGSRWSRWTGSPASRSPRPRSCPRRWR
jgi:hypothetical protein